MAQICALIQTQIFRRVQPDPNMCVGGLLGLRLPSIPGLNNNLQSGMSSNQPTTKKKTKKAANKLGKPVAVDGSFFISWSSRFRRQKRECDSLFQVIATRPLKCIKEAQHSMMVFGQILRIVGQNNVANTITNTYRQVKPSYDEVPRSTVRYLDPMEHITGRGTPAAFL